MTPRLCLTIFCIGVVHLSTAAPFTSGKIVVYRVGDGTIGLTNRGNPVFLDEFTGNGVPVQSIMLPTNAVDTAYPLTPSGKANSEGCHWPANKRFAYRCQPARHNKFCASHDRP